MAQRSSRCRSGQAQAAPSRGRKRSPAAAEVRHRLEVEEALAAVSSMLVADAGVEFPALLSNLGHAVDADIVVLFRFRDGLSRTDAVHEWTRPGVSSLLSVARDVDTATTPWWMSRLSAGDDIVIEDVALLGAGAAAERAMLNSVSIKSCVAVPVRSAGALSGFIGYADVDGRRKWSAEDIRMLRVAGNLIGAWLARLQSQEALRESAEFSRNVINAIDDIVYVMSADGTIASANPAFERSLGTSLKAWLGRNPSPLLHPDDLEATRERFGKAFAGVSHGPAVVRVFDGAGGLKFFESNLTPLWKDGAVAAVMGVARDVTEARRAEDALRENRRMLATLLSNLPGMVYRCRNDRQWTMEFVSEGARPLTGCAPQDLVGNAAVAYADLIHPDDLEYVWTSVQNGVSTGRPFEMTYRIRAVDGVEKWVWEQGRAVAGPPGAETLEGFITDITGRKRAEEALGRSAALVSDIIDQSPFSMWIADADGTNIRQNEACRRLFGIRSDDETVGKYNFFADPVLAEHGVVDDIRRVFTEGRTARFFVDYDFSKVDTVMVPGATHTYLYVTVFPVKDDAGKVVNAVVQHEDLTERRQLEEQLRRAQKMEAVGRLAGGIAHDFNNLLAAIVGYTDLLAARFSPEDPASRDVAEVRRACERAAGLTRQLLAFSRRQVLEHKPVDLNNVISGMDKILRLAAGRQIDLVTSLSASPWPVIADAGQIEQVVMNLAVNARDAMPDGGVLTVSTANVILDGEQAGEFLNVDPGDYVCLCVEDTGAGMDARVRSHLFEPFFTTKEKGKGTGLGLATVYGIVKQSAGGVSVRSAPGAGSAFRVYLPRAADVARPSPPPDSSLAARILVVEDDPLVLDFLARVLSGHGYDVAAARGAEEAMRVCASDAPLDVLITDVTMPVMDGWQLAADVLHRRPSVKVLYISGYAETLPHGPTSPSPDIRFLQKPFSSASLLSKVREVLQPPPS